MDPLAALRACRNLAIAERLATAHPGNDSWRRDRIAAKEKRDDILARMKGQADAPFAAYRTALEIKQRPAARDPAEAQSQRELSILQEKLGDVLAAQSNFPDALAAYADGVAIGEKVPTNGDEGWQRKIARLYDKLGDVLVVQGALDPALQNYGRALAVRQRLPSGNIDWELAVSHGKIGDAQRAQLKSWACTHKLSQGT